MDPSELGVDCYTTLNDGRPFLAIDVKGKQIYSTTYYNSSTDCRLDADWVEIKLKAAQIASAMVSLEIEGDQPKDDIRFMANLTLGPHQQLNSYCISTVAEPSYSLRVSAGREVIYRTTSYHTKSGCEKDAQLLNNKFEVARAINKSIGFRFRNSPKKDFIVTN